MPAARSEAKPKPKSQTTVALCNTCVFKRLTTSTDPVRYLHTHPLRPLLPFFLSTFLYLFSLLSFLSWVIYFHPLSIHYFLLPTISFFSCTSTPFIRLFIHSSHWFVYSVFTTILYSFHPLSFSLSWLKRPVVFLSSFKRKSRQTDSFQTLSYKPAHYSWLLTTIKLHNQRQHHYVA